MAARARSVVGRASGEMVPLSRRPLAVPPTTRIELLTNLNIISSFILANAGSVSASLRAAKGEPEGMIGAHLVDAPSRLCYYPSASNTCCTPLALRSKGENTLGTRPTEGATP